MRRLLARTEGHNRQTVRHHDHHQQRDRTNEKKCVGAMKGDVEELRMGSSHEQWTTSYEPHGKAPWGGDDAPTHENSQLAGCDTRLSRPSPIDGQLTWAASEAHAKASSS